MAMKALPESTRLLYAQLLSQCSQGAAPSGRGLSFVSKRVNGGKYWYLQVTVGSGKTQRYIGPDTAEVLQLIQLEQTLWSNATSDFAAREQLVSMLTSGGAYSVSSTDGRIFELLERAGVFLAKGCLVGSHAFALYGNMLGVRWESETTRTQDVDLATERHVVIGIDNRKISLGQAIVDSGLGFIEVRALNRKAPSTKFRIRGQQLSVDILTPMVGRTNNKAVHIPALDVFAEPVRFLDYLLTDIQPAVVVAKAGLLVNVPAPARFALHKLVIAERRVAAFHSKAQKDRAQADQLLRLLARDRPGDLRRAWKAAQSQPAKFLQLLRAAAARMPAESAEIIEKLIRVG
jgi:hypothetical protein